MLYSSEEATTCEMGSIGQHRPLQSIYIILHLEQTAGPGFQKLQENTKTRPTFQILLFNHTG